MEKKKFYRAQLAVGMFLALAASAPAFAGALLSDDFTYPNGLITNEYTFWNPNDTRSVKSSIWEMTSGSLFANGNAGWSGVPDDKNPNSTSSNGNDSAVFRLTTQRSDFGDVAVSLSLLNQGLTPSPSTPAVAWDGLHIWLRYQSEEHLYYASINRRDNTVVIKKKIPGGPSNGGTYYELSPYVPHVVPYGTWQQVKATVQNNADGSVTIKLYDGNTLLVSATDDGSIGGAPIRAAGKVGMRGDNANLKFDNFAVTALSGSAPSIPTAPSGVAAVGGDSQVTISWKPVTGATSYNLYRSRFAGVTKANGYKVANVASPKVNTGFVNGTKYYMVVTAVNAAGESVASVEVSAVPSLQPPPAPSGVKAIPGDSQVTVSWTPVAGATSYNLYRSRFPGVTKANGYKVPNVSSPRLNTGFVNGTVYYMVVTAVNALGEGPESVEVSAKAGSVPGSSSLAGQSLSDLTATRVYPNPWRRDQQNGTPIIFDHLTSNATVKIFTLSGNLVTTLQTASSLASWDLKNTSGENVASGLYFYLITNDDDQKSHGTLAVVQ